VDEWICSLLLLGDELRYLFVLCISAVNACKLCVIVALVGCGFMIFTYLLHGAESFLRS
jgi:hypothetical protein